MKSKSPTHKVIQLRRRTEKIVIPKASWDLSNKENKDHSNYQDRSTSKNNSSKKSSLSRNMAFKKTSIPQNTLKNSLKSLIRQQPRAEKKKPHSKTRSNCTTHKTESKLDSSAFGGKNFTESMATISRRANAGEDIGKIRSGYNSIFKNLVTSTPQQKLLVKAMQEHLGIWMSRCESLHEALENIVKKTPKLNEIEQKLCEQEDKLLLMSSHGFDQAYVQSPTESVFSQAGSDPSSCSYIVDPQQSVQHKPLAEELKKKLQLNFSQIDSIRKREYE